MNNTLLFLSGLPRSGSTLLGSLLSQHPNIYVTPTSPLSDLLCLIDKNFSELDIQYTYDKKNIVHNTYSSILDNFYNHIPKQIIIDKHRAWPRNIDSIRKFTGKEPKVICTNRRISEIISSYVSLIEKNRSENNFIDNHLRNDGKEITTDNRVEYLWRFYVSDPYESVVFGLNNFRKNIHLVDYNDLVSDPKNELLKIYQFLEVDNYDHHFDNIINTCAEEKDFAWGIENLHKIRSKLEKISPNPEEVIGEQNTILFDKFNI